MTRVQATRTIRRQSPAVSYIINAVPSVLVLGAAEKVWTRAVEVSVTRLAGGAHSVPDCSLQWCTVSGDSEGAWQNADPSGTVLPVHCSTTLQSIDEVRLRALLSDGTVVATASVPVVREGPEGPQGPPGADGLSGPEGAVLRVTEWVADTAYSDGAEAGDDGVRYIDVVTVSESGGGVARFRCIGSHTSSAGIGTASNPGGCPVSGECNPELWEELSDTGPIYTSLLLAPNARIGFLDSQEIIIYESDGSVVGRMGAPMGPDEMTIMYAGGETLDDATYRLDCDGSAYWGEPGGNMIEVDPVGAQIVVRNGGERCTYIEANRYDGPVGARLGDVVKGLTQSVPDAQTGAGGLYTETTEVECGSFRLMRAAKVSVSVPVTVHAHNSGVWRARVSARIEIRDNAGETVSEFSVPLSLDGTAETSNWGDTLSGYAEAGIVDGLLRPRPYTVHLIVSVTHSGGQVGTSHTSTVTVILRRGMRVKLTEREGVFEAHYYANGYYVGTGVSDYVTAWQDGPDGMAFEAVNGAGHGIGVDSTGVKVMHDGGWLPLADYIRGVVVGEIE